MSVHTTLIVEWRGPLTLEEIESNPEWSNGLYMATGRLKYERSASIQYCGITEGSFFSRLRYHHKVDQIFREQRFWLGSVKYPSEVSRHYLELVESMIIYFWKPALNERKKLSSPKSITLINRWFKKDNTPRYRQHTLCKDIEDVISWDGNLWRLGNLQVYDEIV
ncbi:hypothetical protein [Pseudomonas sp. QD4]|uniref:hypothetical protein n=1 Tax=Pseudomonas sp. QD4 TaxID=3368618 RepID=UPI003BA1375B